MIANGRKVDVRGGSSGWQPKRKYGRWGFLREVSDV
jgi:hypothetical protein|tara:strand:- start:551 stop:658 length:108 start_codon:yes stop_codon:yes gene_type:complete